MHFLSVGSYSCAPVAIVITGLLAVVFNSCSPPSTPRFSKVTKTRIENYHPEFAKHCQSAESTHPELNAVLSSIFGDYKAALDYATADAKPVSSKITFDDNRSTEEAAARLRQTIADTDESPELKMQMRSLLQLLEGEQNTDSLFADMVPLNAKDHILNEAEKHHFLLINESHYSSQNRAFTAELLKPLWEQGYRYLALEALGHTDSLLEQRGYPILTTGFYTRDPVFGNMIRDALALGYNVIAYETTTLGSDGTEREADQAINIFNRTLKKDSIGKVIVHAGYGHIIETARGSFVPMGAQLKALCRQDILTVDQERMTDLYDDSKLNSYYLHVKTKLSLDQPVIFWHNEPLVDPISYGTIDLQVYHPPTDFINGRPSWRIRPPYTAVSLPKSFGQFDGHLIQALRTSDQDDAVPVDQTIVYPGTALILPPGSYTIKLIDPGGALVATSSVLVKEYQRGTSFNGLSKSLSRH